MWDFTKVKWASSKAMRYDTPGDWHGDLIEAWEGMPLLSQRAVQLHEFNESAILRAAGVTPEIIDAIDEFRIQVKNGVITLHTLDTYRAISPEILNLYDEAHVIALMVERAFLEAAGGNWQDHCKMIEDSRGKIPVVQP